MGGRRADDGEMPIGKVVIGILGVTLFLLWGTACSMYDDVHGSGLAQLQGENGADDPDTKMRIRMSRKSALTAFFMTAVMRLNDIPAVLGHVFKDRFWFVIVSLVILTAIAGFGLFMKKMEQSLNSGNKYKRRR